MQLIGLTGRAGVGKDTVGKILFHEHQYTRIAFADPLRAMIWAGLDLSYHHLIDRSLKEVPLPWLGRSPRQLLQTLGTDWGRDLVHKDIWLILCRRKIERLIERGMDKFVITDVRFNNEADFVREQGGRMVHIFRDVPAVNTHVSEAGVRFETGKDFTLPNYDDLDRLAEKIGELVKALT